MRWATLALAAAILESLAVSAIAQSTSAGNDCASPPSPAVQAAVSLASNVQPTDDAQAVSDDEIVRRALQDTVTQSENRRAQLAAAGGNLDEIEEQLAIERVRLARHSLKIAEAANRSTPGSVPEAEIQGLRQTARIRWGRPQDGLQAGLELLSQRVSVAAGAPIHFRLVVRNASNEDLRRTVRYQRAGFEQFRLFVDGRFAVNGSGPTDQSPLVVLPVGALAPLPKTQFQVDTTGLRPGRYYVESYQILEWGEPDSYGRSKSIRPPDQRITPSDLRLEFEVLGEQVLDDTEPAAAPPELRHVAWGPANQGLQGGVRYVKPGEQQNDPALMHWRAGETVHSEFVVRNLAREPITISFMSGYHTDLAALRSMAHSVTPEGSGAHQRAAYRGNMAEAFEDSGRNIRKTLAPGEVAVIGQGEFELTPTSALDRINRPPVADHIGIEPGANYKFASSMSVRGKPKAWLYLRTGNLPLRTTAEPVPAK